MISFIIWIWPADSSNIYGTLAFILSFRIQCLSCLCIPILNYSLLCNNFCFRLCCWINLSLMRKLTFSITMDVCGNLAGTILCVWYLLYIFSWSPHQGIYTPLGCTPHRYLIWPPCMSHHFCTTCTWTLASLSSNIQSLFARSCPQGSVELEDYRPRKQLPCTSHCTPQL